ncbi:hypothetical protein [Streptomyces olivoreticuli]|uniref:hypothetical protein n=1 Tax=Streptomyces olivoreticuli TaxID=68246 RepID=UPI0013C2BAF7|nr:hypothetical protein [Streptomyces olivoreticuli]
MRAVRREELDDVLLWVRRNGFPGEFQDGDLDDARRLLASAPGIRAVVVALGAQMFWWVDAAGDEPVQLVAEFPAGPRETAGGFALGTGDGATLPGLPVSWTLLEFRCPQGDTTVLVARYPTTPLSCPEHHVPLELREAGT